MNHGGDIQFEGNQQKPAQLEEKFVSMIDLFYLDEIICISLDCRNSKLYVLVDLELRLCNLL